MTPPSPASVAAALREEAARLEELANALHPAGARIPPTNGSAAAQLIAAERKRQVEEEGYQPEHDAAHRGSELAWGAFCYLERAAQSRLPQDDPSIPHVWPWDRRSWKPKGTVVRNLVVAGALIAAEIDARLARGEQP